MKNFKLGWVLLILVATQCTPEKKVITPEEIKERAKQAAIFGFTLVETYKAVFYSQSPQSPNKAPANQFLVAPKVYGPEDKVSVSPNTDLIYVGCLLDLRTEPVVIQVPEIKDRYYSIMLSDLATDVFGYIGVRETGNKSGNYLVLPPNWKGEIPAGFDKVFKATSYYGVAPGRIALKSQDDYPNVKKIADAWRIMPLSTYAKTQAPEKQATLNFPPMFDARTGEAEGFFKTLAFAMQLQHFSDSDADELKNLDLLGVKKGTDFSTETWTKEMKEALQIGVDEARKEIAAKSMNYRPMINGWNLSPINAGRFGQDYLTRAATGWNLLWPNTIEEAFYPSAYVDNQGLSLDGSKGNYIIEMSAQEIPPVHYYWSITSYKKSDGLLWANPINRFAVNSIYSNLKIENDKLTIYLQNSSPGKDKESNWIPVPKEEFYVVMRLYGPKQEVLKEFWKPAPIKKSK